MEQSSSSLSARWRSLDDKQCTDTGMALTLIFLIFGLFADHIGWLSIAAIVSLVVTMTSPKLLKPIAIVWFAATALLGAVMSRVILTVIFACIVVPIGICVQFLRKDPHRIRNFNSNDASFFIRRDHTFMPEDLTSPF